MNRTITRRLLTAMRAVAGRHGEYDVRVKLTRAYGRRRYVLEYVAPLHAGTSVLLDTTRGELWVAAQPNPRLPLEVQAERAELWERMRPALDTAVSIQREHGEPVNTAGVPGRETYRIV